MVASNSWVRSNVSPSGGMTTGKRRERRVLIVDDHPIVRQGLRRVMENEDDLTVCGEAETARDARIAIKELNPDVMIADISLKQGDGIELVRDVRAHYPSLPILVLSMHDETIYAERMLSAGANGYIMKQAASEQFLIALRRVLDGNIYVSEAVGNNMIQKFASGGAYVSANPIDRLSNRELQILHMIGKGMSTRETALSLNLSIKTVESHRQRIKRKLNLNTGTQLVQYAVNWFTGREAGGAQHEGGLDAPGLDSGLNAPDPGSGAHSG
jgi:DNA-binding NarL/FixJ family response regulator